MESAFILCQCVDVYSVSIDNQLSLSFIVAQSIWTTREPAVDFIFYRTKNRNPGEVRIQEDDSFTCYIGHENSIIRIECQIAWIGQPLCLILRNKTTDDKPSVSGYFTNDAPLFQRVKDDEIPAGCLNCMTRILDI